MTGVRQERDTTSPQRTSSVSMTVSFCLLESSKTTVTYTLHTHMGPRVLAHVCTIIPLFLLSSRKIATDATNHQSSRPSRGAQWLNLIINYTFFKHHMLILFGYLTLLLFGVVLPWKQMHLSISEFIMGWQSSLPTTPPPRQAGLLTNAVLRSLSIGVIFVTVNMFYHFYI